MDQGAEADDRDFRSLDNPALCVGAGKITRFMFPRRRAHMIFVPSGDQRGLTNSPAASVSCITPLPSRFITKSWNRSFTRRENTTRLPSLDHAGQPSSAVSAEML